MVMPQTEFCNSSWRERLKIQEGGEKKVEVSWAWVEAGGGVRGSGTAEEKRDREDPLVGGRSG